MKRAVWLWSHALMGGTRRAPRCRGGGPVFPYPSIGVSGFAPVWALSIFSSSCVVVRAWCLESAALLLAAVLGERARRVRRAVRRACACCCPVAVAIAAAACALRLSWCAACVQCEVRAWRLRARARWVQRRGGSACPCCERGVALLREWRACGPHCACAQDAVDVAAGRRGRGRGQVPRCDGRMLTALPAPV